MLPPLTAHAILSEPAVLAEIRRAFQESDVGGRNPVEQGGFILQDSEGMLSVVRLPATGPDSLAYPICPDGTYQDLAIAGSFHTHPNSGPEWQQEPSAQDIRASIEYAETIGAHQFVVARDAVYHIDNEGTVTKLGETTQILQFKPQGSA